MGGDKYMPWKSATKVEISENQERILQEYAVGTHTPYHLKIRAHIVLKAAEGCSNNSIERAMGLEAKVVKRWRDRYSARYEELRRVETETPRKLRSSIEKTLSDEQRPGGPPKFTDVQVAAILALACEDPAQHALPFSHWTPGALQIEVIKHGIVDSISVRQIGRFLKRKGLTTA
jgi:putative transposase